MREESQDLKTIPSFQETMDEKGVTEKASEKVSELRIPVSRIRWGRIVTLVAVLLAVSFLIVRPGVIGFGVIDDANLSNESVNLAAAEEKDIKSLSKQELMLELEKIRTNISAQNMFSGALITQINEANEQLTACEVEKESLNGDKEQLEKDLQDKEAKIASIEQEKNLAIDTRVNELTASLGQEKAACEQASAAKDANVTAVQDQFDLFVKNMARSVCCKAKVDNPNIKAYDVVDNKLACLESGPQALEC